MEQQLNPAIEKAKAGEIELLFCDAPHFTLSAFHGRNRINVLGAVNAVGKEVTTVVNTTYIRVETIMEFFVQLKERYNLKPIFLVLDNAGYQHCNAVKEKAEALGITLVFLPHYSPNLNIIERLWKFTKKQILYAQYYESPERFQVHQQFRNTVSPYPIYPKDHSSASPSKTPTFIFPPMR